MDAISRLNRLMETLRQQLAGATKRTSPTSGHAPTHGPQPVQRPTVEQLRARIHERILALGPDDPERRRKAQRLFLEAVIAWEFGEQLLMDSELNRLIDRLEATFASEPEMEHELNAALQGLESKPS